MPDGMGGLSAGIPGSGRAADRGDSQASRRAGSSGARADVSVIIPTYDRTDLLAATIRSVLAQTVRPREIIVVDNGGTGHATKVTAAFGDDVRLIVQSPRGKQVARNSGIAAATSTWVALLDDDDLYRPTFLESMEPIIRDGRASVISSDFRKFDRIGPRPKTNFEYCPPGYWDGVPRPGARAGWSLVGKFPLERLLERIPFFPSTMLVRKDLALAVGGYDPGVHGILGEDIEFLARILHNGELAIVWEPLVDYRLHPGNATAGSRRRGLGRWRIFEYVAARSRHLPASFIAATRQNLVTRRVAAFDLAFSMRDFGTMREVAPMLRARDWIGPRPIKLLLASSARARAALRPDFRPAARQNGAVSGAEHHPRHSLSARS